MLDVMETSSYDVVILGAGAAGLFAAIFAAERGRRVLLLEKGKKAGVKILMSGGTRCNITHDCDKRGIIDAFGTNGKFLHSALAVSARRMWCSSLKRKGLPRRSRTRARSSPSVIARLMSNKLCFVVWHAAGQHFV